MNKKIGIIGGDLRIIRLAEIYAKDEFVIYTVGYNQKQIVNYIHKLSKELKKLPYNYGDEFGYSMIENNLKTVEDALTEAIDDMKSKKKDI